MDLIKRKGIDAVFEGNKTPKTEKSKTKKRVQLTAAERVYVWEHKKKYGRTCNICGEEILKLSDLELEHTKPYSKGGEEMVLAHRECNRMKGSKNLKRVQTKMKLKPKG
jgi:5-methylcytosine-specific restriction endonuclease McrA